MKLVPLESVNVFGRGWKEASRVPRGQIRAVLEDQTVTGPEKYHDAELNTENRNHPA